MSESYLITGAGAPSPESARRLVAGKFRHVFDALDIGVAVTDSDRKVRDANAALLNMVGESAEALEAGRIDWRERLGYNLDPERHATAAGEIERAGHCSSYETEFVRPSGERTPVRVTLIALETAQPGELLMLATDLTRDQQTANRLRTIFESGTIGVAISTRDRMTEVNDALLDMIGVNRGDFDAGRVDWRKHMLFDEYGAMELAALDRLDALGIHPTYRKELLHADGRRVPVEVTMALTGGADAERIALVADVSARREAEAAHAKSEARFRRIFESGLVGIGFGAPDGHVGEVNDALLEMLGMNREEFERDPPNWRDMIPREYAAQIEAGMASMLERGYTDVYEREFVRRDGSRLIVEVAAALVDPDDPAGDHFAVVGDISARKEAEDALATRMRQQEVLTEFAEHLLESRNPAADALPWLLERLRDLCSVDICISYVPDGDGLRLTFADGIPSDVRPSLERLRLGESICGMVAQSRQVMDLRHVQQSTDAGTALIRSLGARAYLCMPAVARGELFGTFSVGSRSVDAFDDASVQTFAQAARLLALARQRAAAERALAENETRLSMALRAARAVVWDRDVSGEHVRVSDGCKQMLGLGLATPDVVTAEEALRTIHPEDKQRVIDACDAAIADNEYCDFVFRTTRDGETRWIQTLGQPMLDDTGQPTGLVALNLDVTEQFSAIEREKLLAREVDHRAKNLLSIVHSILQVTRSDDVAEFKQAVSDRVQALARINGLLAGDRWDGADIVDIVETELAPFRDGKAVHVTGPPLRLSSAAAQAVALVLHELATNAVKHGSLSRPTGTVAIAWRLERDGALQLVWRERGGPRVEAPPQRHGFGSTLIAGTIEHQLSGGLRLEWAAEGLTVEIVLPAEHVSASDEGGGPPAGGR